MKMQRRFQNMNIFENAAGVAILRWGKQSLVFLLSLSLLFATLPPDLSAQDEARTATAGHASPGAQAPTYAQQTPEQLQRLVAPIALYPDSLVAQILAASTFPERSRRSRPMGAGESRFEGRRFG